MTKGVKLRVNFTTGERAGGLDPRDRRTRTNPDWQDDTHEVRIVEDEAILDEIDTTGPDVRVLNNDVEIDKAVSELSEKEYVLEETQLVTEHLRQKGKSLDDYTDSDGKPLPRNELAKALYNDGIVGTRAPNKRPNAADLKRQQ